MHRHLEKYRLIGKRIAYYRKRKGLSQEALAEKIGVSRIYISLIEAPQSPKPFSLDVLLTIADGLDIDPLLFFAPVPDEEDGKTAFGLKDISNRMEIIRDKLSEVVRIKGVNSKEALLISHQLDEIIAIFMKIKAIE